jgi:hypothetical protein
MMRLGIAQRSRRAGTGCSKEHCPKFLAHDPGAAQGLEAVVNDHVCVDSTLIDAWALMKASNQSIRRRAARVRRRPGGGRNAEAEFHGAKRTNARHASTHPERQLYRKGRGKKTMLRFMGHSLMERRPGSLVNASLTEGDGEDKRVAAYI